MSYGLSAADAARANNQITRAMLATRLVQCREGDTPERYHQVQEALYTAIIALSEADAILASHDRLLLPCERCYRPGVECICP